jgi:hypothetical protein
MKRRFKIILFTLAGLSLVFVVLVGVVLVHLFRPEPEHSKEAQLSNAASCACTASNTMALTAFPILGMLLIKRPPALQKNPPERGEAAGRTATSWRVLSAISWS